jgi:hypothetical protein
MYKVYYEGGSIIHQGPGSAIASSLPSMEFLLGIFWPDFTFSNNIVKLA